MNILVDTSIWYLALRRRAEALSPSEKALVGELAELVREGRASILGIVRQEVLSGIKTLEQYEKLRGTLRAFPDQPLTISDYEAAAKASNTCRSKGVAVPVVDALICAVGATFDWPIFTTDPDFKSYATLLPIKLHSFRR